VCRPNASRWPTTCGWQQSLSASTGRRAGRCVSSGATIERRCTDVVVVIKLRLAVPIVQLPRKEIVLTRSLVMASSRKTCAHRLARIVLAVLIDQSPATVYFRTDNLGDPLHGGRQLVMESSNESTHQACQYLTSAGKHHLVHTPSKISDICG
jgi:hypothetical protein